MTDNPLYLLKGANPDTFYVRRIEEDISYERGLNLCIACDTIRKAAATTGAPVPRILVREHI